VTLSAPLCGVIGSHAMLMTMTLHKMGVIYGTYEHIYGFNELRPLTQGLSKPGPGDRSLHGRLA